QRSECFLQVRIQPARIGVRRPKLRKRERAEQRQHAADDPCGERHAARTGVADHPARREKDPRSDDRADGDEDQIAQRQGAAELHAHRVILRESFPLKTSRRSVTSKHPFSSRYARVSLEPLRGAYASSNSGGRRLPAAIEVGPRASKECPGSAGTENVCGFSEMFSTRPGGVRLRSSAGYL